MKTPTKRVNMTSDGLALSPAEYADLLVELAQSGKLNKDDYGHGGSVEEFERAMANELGKEAAVVMPTGTMANLLAIEYLAGRKRKVVVQQESHMFNDCGDCGPGLANLQLTALGKGATFSKADVQSVIDRADRGKVAAPLGVVSVETPVRRLDGEMFDIAALDEVVQLARANNVRLHLDGARLPVVAACSGRSMCEIAAPFDTVYVSLYKCFNSLSGAIIAGDKKGMEQLRQWRRRNGGGMAQLWPIAAVAHHYLDNVVGKLEEAFAISKSFFALLEQDNRFEIQPVLNGSSVFRIVLSGADQKKTASFREHLETLSVFLPAADAGTARFTIKVNASWRRSNGEAIFSAFRQAADQ